MNHCRSHVCLKCFHTVRFGDKIIYFQISGNENYLCSDIFLLKRYAYYKLNMDFILSIEIIHGIFVASFKVVKNFLFSFLVRQNYIFCFIQFYI